MPTIVDYPSLVQAVVDFTHRSDLTAKVDYFIQGAQEQINNDIFEQNDGNGVKWMEQPLSGAIDANGHLAVPSDYLSLKNAEVVVGNGQVVELLEKGVAWIYDTYPVRSGAGVPRYIAREGSNFIFGPYPDSSYTIQGYYYQLAPLLSNSAPTNWMVLNCPTMLHAACMLKAQPFIRDPDGLTLWGGIYSQQLESLINRDKAERWNASALCMEVV